MPKTAFDWLALALAWVGSIVLAIKTGGVALIQGAPSFLASPLWGYVPFTTVSAAALMMLFRAIFRGRVRLRRPAAVGGEGVEMPSALIWGSTPNTDLAHVYGHMVDSSWARNHDHDDAAIDQELRDKLHLGRLPVFGRVTAGGTLDELRGDIWASVNFDPEAGCLVGPDGKPMYFGVQFDMDDVERVWPSWRDRYGL